MDFCLPEIKNAYSLADPKAHLYSGQCNDWLYQQFGRDIIDTENCEDAVDIVKRILALGISIGEGKK